MTPRNLKRDSLHNIWEDDEVRTSQSQCDHEQSNPDRVQMQCSVGSSVSAREATVACTGYKSGTEPTPHCCLTSHTHYW